jgi:hypothetical protein
MFHHIKVKKLSSIITGTSRGTYGLNYQMDVIAQWNTFVPKVYVVGQDRPHNTNGVRWIQAQDNPPVSKVLGAYIMQMPGTEVCILAAPNVHIGGDSNPIIKHITDEAMELAWASYLPNDKDPLAPLGFVMSASVCSHLVTKMPINLTFVGDEWSKWTHEWLRKSMFAHRYFDASKHGITTSLPPPPILNAYEIAAPTQSKKKKLKR